LTKNVISAIILISLKGGEFIEKGSSSGADVESLPVGWRRMLFLW